MLEDQFNVNIVIPQGDRLSNWPAKEDNIFYYMKDIFKTIKPPEIKKCELNVLQISNSCNS